MTWRFFVAPVLALLALAPALVGSAEAQRPDRRDGWELLGRQEVGLGVDRDVIKVGSRAGLFTKIALEVARNDVEIKDLTVIFHNGQKQDVKVRQFIRAGGRTRPIDLAGAGRFIDRIVLVYRSRPGSRDRAVVSVFGYEKPLPPLSANWEELGRQEVGLGVDRDIIKVGRREGSFSKILLELQGNDIEIKDLTVVFGNGQKQDVQVRQFMRAGTRTKAIDLAGEKRHIERIIIVYRARPGSRERAVMKVYGYQKQPPRPRWEELGCEKVGFGRDRDIVKVGRREGRFSAIRLRVDRADVMLLKLKVVYVRGPADEIDVKKRISAGEDTPPLDLRGERRAIEQVELVYSSIPSFKGSARVCVDGRN